MNDTQKETETVIEEKSAEAEYLSDEFELEEQPEESKKTTSFWKGFAGGILLMLVLVAATLGVALGIYQKGSAQQNAVSEDILGESVEAKIKSLAGIIQLYYYEDVDVDNLVDGLYKGLMEGIDDPYSEYYTAEEYQSLQESNEGTYQGIGAVLSQNAETMAVTILRAYDGSPAQEAGLRTGDVIVSVDDIEANSMELSELVTHIRGEAETTTHLVVAREGESDYMDFDVERRAIEVPTVASQMLDDKTGYIQIAEFSEVTAGQFETQVEELKEQGMKAMVVDLRDNPGGLVTSVVQILDDILPEGTVVYTQDKYENRNDYTSEGDTYMELPIAVLINGNSASASEIFAGAIRDFDYGTLIGTTSFGKGIVQTILPLDDGSAIKITTAKYYTPNGDYIHGVGIDPDIDLEFEYQSEDTTTYDIQYDNQVQKALEVVEDELK